ncbi:siderophore-interacting protein [Kitasatospora sp. NPDC004240]
MFRRPRPSHDVTVSAVTPLTSTLVRLTLHGPTLDALALEHPTQWAKLEIPDGTRRAYTIRHHRPAAHEVDVDVVLHGNGPAALWAATARPGARARLGDPRGRFTPVPPGHRLLLAADESALPAALTVLEDLPPDVRAHAWFEVADPADTLPLPAGVDVTWLARTPDRPKGQLLATTVRHSTRPLDSAWIAGEATAVAALRRHLLDDLGILREHVRAKGYWKLGEADHKG